MAYLSIGSAGAETFTLLYVVLILFTGDAIS